MQRLLYADGYVGSIPIAVEIQHGVVEVTPCPGTRRRDAHTVAQGFDPCIGASRWRASTLRPWGHL